MKDVAEGDGDLSRRLEVPPDREVAELAGWFNTFTDRLQAILVSVAQNVQHLAAAGEELSANSRQQAQGAEQQKDQIHQTATATQQMTVAVQQVTEAASRTAESARKSAEAARRGGKVVEETLTRMQAIAASTTEAARVGTQGRGFAVVADEVRKLAERTTKASEIAQMIHAVQEGTRLAVAAMQAGTKEVDLGVAATREAGAALHEIIDISDRVGDMISHIASAATEQAGATTEMNRSAECIAEIAAVAATGALEATKALEDLANLATEIQRQVGQFRLDFKANASAPGCEKKLLARSAAVGL